jgi:hypothetical protein
MSADGWLLECPHLLGAEAMRSARQRLLTVRALPAWIDVDQSPLSRGLDGLDWRPDTHPRKQTQQKILSFAVAKPEKNCYLRLGLAFRQQQQCHAFSRCNLQHTQSPGSLVFERPTSIRVPAMP